MIYVSKLVFHVYNNLSLLREEHSDMLESFPEEVAFILCLEQFVEDKNRREIPFIPGRENSMSRS